MLEAKPLSSSLVISSGAVEELAVEVLVLVEVALVVDMGGKVEPANIHIVIASSSSSRNSAECMEAAFILCVVDSQHMHPQIGDAFYAAAKLRMRSEVIAISRHHRFVADDAQNQFFAP